MDTPLPNTGIYALRHKASGSLYIGSSMNLRARREKWWAKLNADRGALAPTIRALGSSRLDWEFIVVSPLPGATPDELVAAERRAVAHVWARAPERLLNTRTVVRADDPRLVVDGVHRSLRGWSDVTGIPRATISSRLVYGWTPEQALGLTPAPIRDRRAEHTAESRERAAVVVYDGLTPLSSSAASERLNCRIETLRERLRKYRVPGGQGRVQLADLRALSEKYRR